MSDQGAKTPSPDPTLPAAALWLKSVDRDYLHKYGWIIANRRFHGLALAARPFINKHFDDPAEQQAAFDGFALALTALAHFEDVKQLSALFENAKESSDALPEKILPPPAG